MAKPNNAASFVNVDETVLEPSPQRVRNILTLEERVRAIQAYDCRPMYTKVAKMFNCSWEQIKNIISNRKAIMEFYAATKSTEKIKDPNQDDIRRRKIIFLGECMYEYIQRAQFHAKADIREEMLRMKAFEFRDVIQIENFTPNRAWINHFKATYKFSLSNRQIMLTRTPPASLDLKDIMTYCTKNKVEVNNVSFNDQSKNLYRTQTKISLSTANDATLAELKQRRERKINFLEKALYEYIHRAKFHHKIPWTDDLLRKVACDLKDMLKIDSFFPNKSWLSNFKSQYDLNISPPGDIIANRTPPLSLDLKDILSFCSRNGNKNSNTPATIKLAPKETPQVRTVKKIYAPPISKPTVASTSLPSSSQSLSSQSPHPLVLIHTLDLNQKTDKPPLKRIKTEIVDDDDDHDESVDVKPNVEELQRITQENEKQRDAQVPPPMKIQKIESIAETINAAANSPGHWSEHSDKEDEALPNHVTNYQDALKLLKPLEEFAMLKENYRVIGLISQLEEIFKNPPKKDD